MKNAVENQEIYQLEQIISQRTNKNPCIHTNCSRTVLLHLATCGFLDGYKLVSEMAGTRNPSNSAGISPLKLAAKVGHLEIVKYIIDGGDLENSNPKDDTGETPIFAATKAGHLETVKFLVEIQNDDIAWMEIGLVDSPIHVAILESHLDIFEYFEDFITDWIFPTKDGLSLLHCAVLSKNLWLVKRISYQLKRRNLIQDILELVNGTTPLHYAIENKFRYY